MEEKDNVRVNVEFTGALEPKQVDIEPYIGRKARIEGVETKYNTQHNSYYLRVETEPLGFIDEAHEKPLRASKLFSLMNQEGVYGWRKGGDLDLFLKANKASMPHELVGKTVIAIPTKPNKDGARFLTFN